MPYNAQSRGENASHMYRRTFFRLVGSGVVGGLATLLVPTYEVDRIPLMEQRMKELNAIRANNRRLAQEMLITKGPEEVKKMGLEPYLADPELSQMDDPEKLLNENPQGFFANPTLAKALFFAGAAGVVYLTTTQRLAEKMYDAYSSLRHKAKKGKLNEKEFKAYAAIAAALGYGSMAACNGNGISTAPSGLKSNITLQLSDTENGFPNAKVEYIRKSTREVLANGTVTNGSSTVLDIENGTLIDRIRIYGAQQGPGGNQSLPPFITLERDLSQTIRPGDNTVNITVKSRTPNLPMWYNVTNRDIGPLGNKKTVGPIKLIANPAGITSDPVVRVDQVEQAARYAVPILTGFPFVDGQTYQITDRTVDPGDNIFPVRFAQAFGTSNFVYEDTYRLVGSVITEPRFSASDETIRTDISEIAEGTRFPGESNLIRPSIANDAPPHGRFEPHDLEALAASEFDALGAAKRALANGVVIESVWL